MWGQVWESLPVWTKQSERTGGVEAVTFHERWSQSYKRICGQEESERKKKGNGKQRHRQLNYFSRRALKGIQHSHTESQRVFQPTHPLGHDTPQCYFTTLCFTSKKKRTHDMICLMSYDSVWKCKCETHLHPKSLLLLSLFPSFCVCSPPHTDLYRREKRWGQSREKIKWLM